MPTQRRRIGFLPRSEVQDIIDKICIINKLSQSKVTGILVEEALRSRGVLNTSVNEALRSRGVLNRSVNEQSYEFCSNNFEELLIPNETLNSEIPIVENKTNLDDDSTYDEVKMINDYIEFKFFKNIMNRNKGKIK